MKGVWLFILSYNNIFSSLFKKLWLNIWETFSNCRNFYVFFVKLPIFTHFYSISAIKQGFLGVFFLILRIDTRTKFFFKFAYLCKKIQDLVLLCIKSCIFGCPCQARTDDTRINSLFTKIFWNVYNPLFIRGSSFFKK